MIPILSSFVFVVSGGFFSCKTPWAQPNATPTFTAFKPTLDAYGADSPYVATCFNMAHDKIWYQTDQDQTVLTATPDQYYDLVAARVAAAGPGAELVLIGHSWGGWLAMAHVEALAKVAPIAYLGTIDPISWQECPPSAVSSAIFGSTPAQDADPGCITAPHDLEPSYQGIGALAHRWEHFYQDRFSYLHSSTIEAASLSTHVPFDDLSSAMAWEAHTHIDVDPRVWSVIAGSLK